MSERSNVHGVCNGDLIVRHDGLMGRVTGVWNEAHIQIAWDGEGPIVQRLDGFSAKEVAQRFVLRPEGGWHVSEVGNGNEKTQ